MPDPGTELHNAIYDRLAADPAVAALVYDIYDDTRTADEDDGAGAPWGDELGYITFGPESVIESDVECVSGELITVQVDAWSMAVGREHCRKICFAICDALAADIELESHALANLKRMLFRIFPDVSDGIMHGVLQFTARIERAD